MGRKRSHEKLVSKDQVTPGISFPSSRSGYGDGPSANLHRNRLLKLTQQLRSKAQKLGFNLCRVTLAELPTGIEKKLDAWIASGAHGEMTWLAESAERRADPRHLWPDAKTIVMLGMNYGPEVNPLATLAKKEIGTISVYARHRDYHNVLKGRLKELASFLTKNVGPNHVKVFVDTAPLMEKPLAQAAGLGWQGKHSNLVSREFGSWLFLGAILTDLELTIDDPEIDHCGQCQQCLDACPTQAFVKPYWLDARRCISYLTIELKGSIPLELRNAIGNRIYGCDDCLAVCPWNKFAQIASELKLKARPELEAPPLDELVELDETAFRSFFSGSPIKRIGHTRFLRNVLIAIGNSGKVEFSSLIERRLTDTNPLIRGSAIWAMGQLNRERLVTLSASLIQIEYDPHVRLEWEQALGCLDELLPSNMKDNA